MRILRRSLLAGSAALALFAAAPALAQASQEPVPVAELISEVEIPYEQFTLDNGLRVVVHEDRSAPIVHLSVWYNVGSKDEPAGNTGFAHLFEHLMFGGSENAPGSYLTRMTGLGATDLNGTTWFDRTNYFQTVATPVLETALYLESDRMGHMLGAITQETLDLQRGVVQNEKRQGDNQPYGLTYYALLEALFPEGHPYRHSTIGSMADLDAASMDDTRRWFIDRYGPNNAVLVLAGDIDTATARTLTEKYFGPIPRGPVNTPAQADIPTLAAPVSEVMHDRVATARVSRTWVVPGMLDEDAAALDVAGAVLGGLESSRLDNILVRGEQTAVSASAGHQAFHRLGFFSVSANVKPGQDVDAVNTRLDEIIADYLAEGPTADEIQRVITQRVAASVYGLEQLGGFGGRANALAEGTLYANDPEFFRRRLDAYATLTPEKVREVAQRWLSRPAYSQTVLQGEREPYQQASATPSGAAPAAPIEYTPTPRAPLPEIGPIADLDLPAVERATLGNGIQVVFSQAGSVPATRVAVEFDAGQAADRADAQGLQTLTLNLMQEGADGMNAEALAIARERLGAQIGAGATTDRTSFTLTALTPNLAPSLELLSDVVRRPDFAPAEVERLRAQQLASIASELSQPGGLASRAFYPALYGAEHPYGRGSALGEAAVVQGFDRDDIVNFQNAWIRPDNAKIFVVSDRPLSEVLPQIEAAFGDWTPPSATRGVKPDVAPTPVRPRLLLVNRPQSPQSIIMAGEVLSLTGADDRLVLNGAVQAMSSDAG